MNVLLDCNVIVSAAWNGGICLAVTRYCCEHDLILISDSILKEYERVSSYEKLAQSRNRMLKLIEEIKGRARWVEDQPLPSILPDPGDMIYLSAAIYGAADAIVTGNLKHFPKSKFDGVRILSVREFAAIAGL